MYFISVWASTQELVFITHIKPVLIFTIGYVGAELIKRYKIDTNVIKGEKPICTLIF